MKNGKSVVKFGILLLVGLAILVIGCAEKIEEVETPTPTATPTATPVSTPVSTPKPVPKTTPAPAATVKCEVCHVNPEKYEPHATGGQYCANCHGSKVHDIHIGEGTINLDCKTCHGIPPTIPKAEEGHVVCENCHGYPNPLEPSYGNLVDIHLSRGKYCTNCHGLDLAKMHAAGLKKFEQ